MMVEDSLPDDQVERIQAALFAGRKIEAIKLYREATGTGLSEAKLFVEKIESELRSSAPEQFKTPATKGCMSVLVLFIGLAVVLCTLQALR